MKRFGIAVFAFAVLLGACQEQPTGPSAVPTPSFTLNEQFGDPQIGTSAIFPSTNETNAGLGWAHVEFIDVAVGSVTLDFHQPRSFFACFEYRIDGAAAPAGSTNYNAGVTDGLYAYHCQNGNAANYTIAANQFVDVRMAFGAESDERFDWTRFYVLSLTNKDQCRNDAWVGLGFKNLGQCVRFVETGKDSRIGQ